MIASFSPHTVVRFLLRCILPRRPTRPAAWCATKERLSRRMAEGGEGLEDTQSSSFFGLVRVNVVSKLARFAKEALQLGIVLTRVGSICQTFRNLISHHSIPDARIGIETSVTSQIPESIWTLSVPLSKLRIT